MNPKRSFATSKTLSTFNAKEVPQSSSFIQERNYGSFIDPTMQNEQLLPEKARKMKTFLEDRQKPLQQRLFLAMSTLHDCKYVNKEKLTELKLNQSKTKQGVLSKLDESQTNVLIAFV